MEPSNHTARISLSAILAVLLYIPGLAASQANTSSLEDTTLDQLEQRLSTIDKELSNLAEFSLRGGVGSIGFRSYWHRNPEVREWVKVDLNREGPIDSIVLVPTIWRTMKDGFQSDGFPLAFRIYAGKKGEDEGRLIAEFNEPREFLPRVAPMVIPVDNVTAAWVKIETLRLSNRKYDEKPAFQLAELLVFDRRENVALLQPVTTSSNFGSYSGAWHKRFLTDGFMPYLMNSTRGEPSRAFVTVPGERPEITIDLGKAFSLSGVNFHTIEQSDTVPQAYAGDLGIPANLQIWGSLDREFSNPTLLFHHREASIDINGPIIMRDIPNLNARYVRITPQGTATPGNSSEKFRIGFAEIELLSGGRNVARGKTVEMNTTLLPHQSPLKALTDGRNLYGKILPVRTWMEELAKRHELERERPRVTAEIARRYSKQKSRLQIMTWVAVVSLAGLTILILIERNLRLKNTVKIKQRIAANLHDELGANLHAIGMLGRHASRMDHTSREQSETVARICEIAERTSNATRHCTNLLESKIIGENLLEEIKRDSSRLLAGLKYEIVFEGEQYFQRLKNRRRIDMILFNKECLSNIVRHSQADMISILLSATKKKITLTITDNGAGNIPEIPPSLARRAKLMRARVSVENMPPEGSKITLNYQFHPLLSWI